MSTNVLQSDPYAGLFSLVLEPEHFEVDSRGGRPIAIEAVVDWNGVWSD
jgi:hypothetical protein